MTQTLPPFAAQTNAAHVRAACNYAANRAALNGLQSGAVRFLDDSTDQLEWLFGRDGALTAMLPGAKWWGNCSLPQRTAQFMFKSLEIRGVVGCFLFPVHAAQIRAALDRLEAHQAVLAIVPDGRTLQVIVHCEDFSADINAHRLWFVADKDWKQSLARLFVDNAGLPTPADFIRAISPDQSAADALIGPAQKIFADETVRRGALVQAIALASRPQGNERTSALCVVAPSHFRLWNDAPATLADVIGGTDQFTSILFDSDDPASASPLALAQAVAGADGVVTANLARCDLPAVIPIDVPIVTWITFPRIPAYDPSAARDVLIVADSILADRALNQGWPKDRIRAGAWPVLDVTPNADQESQPAALIADTAPIVPPKAINAFSSHLLLWDLIASELRADPFLVGADIDAYLSSRIKRIQIDESAFNKSLFIEHLILPVYQQSIARALLGRKVPLRLHGKGWDKLEEFAAHSAGPVKSREHFREILSNASALVHAWPTSHAHPVQATSLPIIHPGHLPARRAISDLAPLTVEIIRSALA